MSRERGRLKSTLMIWTVLFALGFASGFVVRDRQHHGEVEEALAKRRGDAQATLERGLRAGKKLQEGTRAAVEELKGSAQAQQEAEGER